MDSCEANFVRLRSIGPLPSCRFHSHVKRKQRCMTKEIVRPVAEEAASLPLSLSLSSSLSLPVVLLCMAWRGVPLLLLRCSASSSVPLFLSLQNVSSDFGQMAQCSQTISAFISMKPTVCSVPAGSVNLGRNYYIRAGPEFQILFPDRLFNVALR